MKFTPANAREMGRKGGLATLRAHGPDHMRQIGKKGFQATIDRHFGGDRRDYLNYLTSKGLSCMDPCPWNGHSQDYKAFPEKTESNP